MKQIEDKSVDLILCDLPYGVTNRNQWDKIINIERLWVQYLRIIKEKGVIVLTATQPFTTLIINSNLKMFKYCWYWNKVCPTGFLNAKKQPLRQIEEVCVFYNQQPTFNPIMVCTGKVRKKGGGKVATTNYGKFKNGYFSEDDLLYPKNIIEISNADKSQIQHPTQKPVALFEYLIKTYTNEGDLVLDNCIGSGTTAVACINTKRNFIGMELEQKYVDIANSRIQKELSQTQLNSEEAVSIPPNPKGIGYPWDDYMIIPEPPTKPSETTLGLTEIKSELAIMLTNLKSLNVEFQKLKMRYFDEDDTLC